MVRRVEDLIEKIELLTQNLTVVDAPHCPEQ